jgi:hypothetical protein
MACGWHHHYGPCWGWYSDPRLYADPLPRGPVPAADATELASLREQLRRIEADLARISQSIGEARPR